MTPFPVQTSSHTALRIKNANYIPDVFLFWVFDGWERELLLLQTKSVNKKVNFKQKLVWPSSEMIKSTDKEELVRNFLYFFFIRKLRKAAISAITACVCLIWVSFLSFFFVCLFVLWFCFCILVYVYRLILSRFFAICCFYIHILHI